MIDRRGHRKLRLTSRKHFQPRPKRFNRNSGNGQPQEEQTPSFKVSVPILAFTDAPASTVNSLQSRFKKSGDILSGILKIS